MRNVDNAQPKPAMAPDPSKKLPGFLVFVQKTKPSLILVQQDDLAPLLECLYKAAEDKVEMERLRLRAQEDEQMFRTGHIALTAAMKPIAKALAILKLARARHAEAWKEIEEKSEGEDWEFSFDQIIQNLEDALEVGGTFRLVYAGQIHPQLRKVTETEMANQTIAGGSGEIAAGSIVSHEYPARLQSADIDHWFIGAASACLEKYRTGTGKTIPRHDKIISKLFDIAFGDTSRDDSNIRTELKRQRKDGRPKYYFHTSLFDHLEGMHPLKPWDKIQPETHHGSEKCPDENVTDSFALS
jgi:hypothetical protein